ncbi:MAG: hypothetical protein FD167_3102 [bacterium]|nr:MAG: hypothetical protein FD167_3102 [bacterium]
MKIALSLSLIAFIVIGAWLNPSNNLANAFSKNLQNAKETKLLSEEEAISLAEDFIIKNGYTNLPPVERKKITPELLDKLVSFELVMKLRHNSLQPKAYGVIKKRHNGSGWTIIFARTSGEDFDPKNGRGVSMGLKGESILMEPREFLLTIVDKKLESASK